ncbi:hypothetical protein D3C76_1527390 [compost metagenome]
MLRQTVQVEYSEQIFLIFGETMLRPTRGTDGDVNALLCDGAERNQPSILAHLNLDCFTLVQPVQNRALWRLQVQRSGELMIGPFQRTYAVHPQNVSV